MNNKPDKGYNNKVQSRKEQTSARNEMHLLAVNNTSAESWRVEMKEALDGRGGIILHKPAYFLAYYEWIRGPTEGSGIHKRKEKTKPNINQTKPRS